MIPSLSQETITEYASDAQTIQEPTGTDYTQGVRVGKTVPAKWWNWLFRGATRRLGQAKTDAQNMLTEMQNVVTDAGFTLDGSDSHQVSKSVVKDADTQIDKYVEAKKSPFNLWAPLASIDVDGTQQAKGDLYYPSAKIAEVNGLHVFRTSYSYICTFDMVHFHNLRNNTVVPFNLYFGGVNNIPWSIGIVYFQGYWYLMGSSRSFNIYNELSVATRILRTTDFQTFESVYYYTSIQVLSTSIAVFPFITVVDGTLYAYNESRQLISSNDGVNFNATGIGQLTLTIPASRVTHDTYCSIEAHILGNNNYIIGLCRYDKNNDTWTALNSQGYMLPDRLNSQLLPGHRVYCKAIVTASTFTYEYFSIDTLYQVTIDTRRWQVAQLQGVYFAFSNVNTAGWATFDITFDGSTIHTILDSQAYGACVTNDRLVFSTSHKLYSCNHPSTSLTDYEMHEIQETVIDRCRDGGYKNCVLLDGSGHYTLDYGAHVLRGTIGNFGFGNATVAVIQGNNFYGFPISPDQATGYLCLSNEYCNHVAGHTLYLR
jgi:hypothetical protein